MNNFFHLGEMERFVRNNSEITCQNFSLKSGPKYTFVTFHTPFLTTQVFDKFVVRLFKFFSDKKLQKFWMIMKFQIFSRTTCFVMLLKREDLPIGFYFFLYPYLFSKLTSFSILSAKNFADKKFLFLCFLDGLSWVQLDQAQQFTLTPLELQLGML